MVLVTLHLSTAHGDKALWTPLALSLRPVLLCPPGQPIPPEASQTKQTPHQTCDGLCPSSPLSSGRSSSLAFRQPFLAFHTWAAADTTDSQPLCTLPSHWCPASCDGLLRPLHWSPCPHGHPHLMSQQVCLRPCPSPSPGEKQGRLHLKPLTGHSSFSHHKADTFLQGTFPEGSLSLTVPPRVQH